MMPETYMTSVTYDGTCPVCGRKLRGLRDLDWLAAGTQPTRCECGARLTVTVGWIYRVEATDNTTAGGAHERSSNGG